VIDGDTMRYSGEAYRLVGFDTLERADNSAQASRDGIDLDQQSASIRVQHGF
jgi:endonuclease YncB( thermonuclease family)